MGKLTHMGDAKIPQNRLNLFDRQPVFVQKLPDPAQQKHIRGSVIAPTTRPFYRFDLGKFAFPKAQNMSLHAEPVRDFADGAKGVC